MTTTNKKSELYNNLMEKVVEFTFAVVYVGLFFTISYCIFMQIPAIVWASDISEAGTLPLWTIVQISFWGALGLIIFLKGMFYAFENIDI